MTATRPAKAEGAVTSSPQKTDRSVPTTGDPVLGWYSLGKNVKSQQPRQFKRKGR